uniref:Uncharacterized protein n=1 Tax=Chromera velia CCMP2878 TaxID=1169474 RepID=A0A0G4I8D1_9ALVE|eukprot:Cvel_11831.t1-p1 / transcript=Cvel_11831.t1 / gene=Cvel_11831 / organism=Chromera_velia_CCMP2878 / gene_product=hypothetical protein / transcript_product=hypothetical protein / location=Cvel_scaffold754:21627-24488(-) / protein_length=535 / sequence_SO=supercontig / SO=protein_coding / is_pseudo=false
MRDTDPVFRTGDVIMVRNRADESANFLQEVVERLTELFLRFLLPLWWASSLRSRKPNPGQRKKTVTQEFFDYWVKTWAAVTTAASSGSPERSPSLLPPGLKKPSDSPDGSLGRSRTSSLASCSGSSSKAQSTARLTLRGLPPSPSRHALPRLPLRLKEGGRFEKFAQYLMYNINGHRPGGVHDIQGSGEESSASDADRLPTISLVSAHLLCPRKDIVPEPARSLFPPSPAWFQQSSKRTAALFRSLCKQQSDLPTLKVLSEQLQSSNGHATSLGWSNIEIGRGSDYFKAVITHDQTISELERLESEGTLAGLLTAGADLVHTTAEQNKSAIEGAFEDKQSKNLGNKVDDGKACGESFNATDNLKGGPKSSEPADRVAAISGVSRAVFSGGSTGGGDREDETNRDFDEETVNTSRLEEDYVFFYVQNREKELLKGDQIGMGVDPTKWLEVGEKGQKSVKEGLKCHWYDPVEVPIRFRINKAAGGVWVDASTLKQITLARVNKQTPTVPAPRQPEGGLFARCCSGREVDKGSEITFQ